MVLQPAEVTQPSDAESGSAGAAVQAHEVSRNFKLSLLLVTESQHKSLSCCKPTAVLIQSFS